jgi:hypothetical protein
VINGSRVWSVYPGVTATMQGGVAEWRELGDPGTAMAIYKDHQGSIRQCVTVVSCAPHFYSG